MNTLLVYPEFPDTYWSFRHALAFEKKRSAFPPLGLLTISALLPPTWQRRLVDLNVESLNADDLAWADVVFVSAMIAQMPEIQQQLSTLGAVPQTSGRTAAREFLAAETRKYEAVIRNANIKPQ